MKLGSKVKLDIAVLISALFFSAAHISFQFSYSVTQLIVAFIAGIIFGMIYKKTNSVWVCMAVHGICNVIAVMT